MFKSCVTVISAKSDVLDRTVKRQFCVWRVEEGLYLLASVLAWHVRILFRECAGHQV